MQIASPHLYPLAFGKLFEKSDIHRKWFYLCIISLKNCDNKKYIKSFTITHFKHMILIN